MAHQCDPLRHILVTHDVEAGSRAESKFLARTKARRGRTESGVEVSFLPGTVMERNDSRIWDLEGETIGWES